MKSRPSMRTGMVGAAAMTIAPIVKSTSAKIMTFFLPILSEMKPEKRAPNAAAKRAIDTIVAI